MHVSPNKSPQLSPNTRIYTTPEKCTQLDGTTGCPAKLRLTELKNSGVTMTSTCVECKPIQDSDGKTVIQHLLDYRSKPESE